MVFESVVANLINKYLAQFIDDVSAEQLNIGTWKGKVSLSNLSIRENAFDSFDLPFRVVHGHIGQIEASIPWSSIYSSPVVCKLKDVFLLAVPNTESQFDEQREAEMSWQSKRRQLEKIEEAKARASKTESDDQSPESDSFATKLAAQIVKNLQITVTNVHLVYEDQITYPNRPFQVGLTLHNLSFQSQEPDIADVDGSAISKVTPEDDRNIVHKAIGLDSLGFYWNCCQADLLTGKPAADRDQIFRDLIATRFKTPKSLEYILAPVTLQAKGMIHRKPEDDRFMIPVADVGLSVDQFSLRLSRYQLESTLMLLDSVDRMRLAAPFRKWRPPQGTSIMKNPKLWWRFAIDSVINTDVRRRFNNWSWKCIKRKRSLMKTYQEAYKQNLMEQSSKKRNLDQMERQMDLFMIILARGQAELEAAQMKSIKIKQDKKKAAKKGWFGSWWGGGDVKDEEETGELEIIDDLKKELNDKEKSSFYEAIGYQENDLLLEFPMEYVAHRLALSLNRLGIDVEEEGRSIASFNLGQVQMRLDYRPASNGVHVESHIKSMAIVGMAGFNLLEEDPNKDVLALEIDLNPLDGDCDYGINMRMSGCKMIYDADTINKVIQIFEPPEDISLSELQSMATAKLEEVRIKTTNQLLHSIEKHKQLKLSIAVDPSFLIVPRDGRLTDRNDVDVLVISLGQFTVSSQLIPKHDRASIVSARDAKKAIEQLKKSAFETYDFRLTKIQVILSNGFYWREDLDLSVTSRHLLHPASAELTISKSIIGNDPDYPRVMIKANLNEIQLKITDDQAKRLMNLLTTLPFGAEEENKEEKKPKKSVVSDEIDSKFKRIQKVHSFDAVADALDFALNKAQEVAKKSEDNPDEATENRKQIICRLVKFDLILEKVIVSLLEVTDKKPSPLAAAYLHRFDVYGEVLNDGTIWTNCLVGDIVLTDTRDKRKSDGIKQLMHKKDSTEDLSQKQSSTGMLSVIFTQKENERFIEVSMSGFRLIFALDYILKLLDFAVNAVQDEEDKKPSSPTTAMLLSTEINKLITGSVKTPIKSPEDFPIKSPKKPVKIPFKVMNVINFNMSQMDIVLLESIEEIDSPAIILTCQASINMKQKDDFLQISGGMKQVDMSLANYQRYLEKQAIDAAILKPCDFTFHGTIKGENQNIDITAEDLKLIISPPMVNTIVSILSKMGSSAVDEEEQEKSLTDVSDLFKSRPNDAQSWYLTVPIVEEVKEAIEEIKEKDFEELDSVEPVDPDEVDLDKFRNAPQKVVFDIKGVQLIIESGGADSRPLLMVTTGLQGQFYGNRFFDGTCTLIANYYNERNHYWEPLLEHIEKTKQPWYCYMQVMLKDEKSSRSDDQRTKVKIDCEEQMELTLTKTSLEMMTALGEAFKSAVINQLPNRDENIVIIKNKLGLDLTIDILTSRLTCKTFEKKTRHLIIKPDEEVYFQAEAKTESDWHNLMVHYKFAFNDNEVVKEVPVGRPRTCCFCLDSSNLKWLVEVETVDSFSKSVTFHTTVEVVNQFSCPLQLFQKLTAEPQPIATIPGNSTYHLPVEIIHSKTSLLLVKPEGDSSLGDQPIDFRKADNRRVMITSKFKDGSEFLIKTFTESRYLKEQIELRSIYLVPVAKLRNLLPLTVKYCVEGVDRAFEVPIGADIDLANVKLGVTGLTIFICDYLDRDWTCSKKLPSFGDDTETFTWTFAAPGHRHQPTVDIMAELKIEGHSIVVILYAQLWLFNKTNQHLVYRLDDDHCLPHQDKSLTPVLVSFKPKKFLGKSFARKTLSLAVADSKYSDCGVTTHRHNNRVRRSTLTFVVA